MTDIVKNQTALAVRYFRKHLGKSNETVAEYIGSLLDKDPDTIYYNVEMMYNTTLNIFGNFLTLSNNAGEDFKTFLKFCTDNAKETTVGTTVGPRLVIDAMISTIRESKNIKF